MTIPENQKKIYTVNKLKDIAYQNYRDVTFFLNNVHFRQPARIPKQALDSTLRKLKYLQDDLNYKPEVQKIIVY